MRISLSTIGALGALHFLVVSAADYCVGTCTNNLRDRFSEFSCSSAEDGACLCRNQSFLDGIRDCSSSSCGATQSEMNTYLSANFCLGVISASSAASAAAPTSVAPTSAAAPTSQTPSATAISSAKTEATSREAWSSTVVQTSAGVLTTTAAKSTAMAHSSSAAEEPNASGSASEIEVTASKTSSDAGAGTAATATSSADNAESSQDSDKKSTGLSIAAQAGIGVGVGAAVLAVLSLGLFCVLKSRRHEDEQKPQRRGIGLAISEPLPGGGRVYGSNDGAFGEKNAYDMEVITNRYEDMVPRHTPRTMV